MTRKHFEAAAVLVAALPTHKKRLEVADVFVALFSQFNPRFDAARFYGKVGKLAAKYAEMSDVLNSGLPEGMER